MKNVGDILTAFMLKHVNIFIFPTIHKCIEYCGGVKVKGLNYFRDKLIHILQSLIFRLWGVMVKSFDYVNIFFRVWELRLSFSPYKGLEFGIG